MLLKKKEKSKLTLFRRKSRQMPLFQKKVEIASVWKKRCLKIPLFNRKAKSVKL